MKIECWTDGSSIDNGKPSCVGGWASVFFIGSKRYVRYGHLKAQSSSSRAEISAVLYTIQSLKTRKDWSIQVYSDSQYVVNSINEWRHKWKRSNYAGVKNGDLLIPLFEAWDEHGNAKITWVKGHVGTPGNELADRYAGMGSKNEVYPEYKDLNNDIKYIDEQQLYRK